MNEVHPQRHTRATWRRSVGWLAAVSLLAACGGDDSEASPGTAASTTASTDSTASTVEPTPEETAVETSVVTSSADTSPATVETVAGPVPQVVPLDSLDGLVANMVDIGSTELDGRTGVQVTLASGVVGGDLPTVALLADTTFGDGVIELDLAGDTLDPSNGLARGFAGIMFHLADDLSAGEGVYLRPLNAVDPDPARQQRVLQYFSYPSFPFSVSREESPGVYETGADVAPGEWVHLRIVIDGSTATVFVGDAAEPTLVVDDLRLGAGSGGIGLWTDQGSVATFANLVITPAV